MFAPKQDDLHRPAPLPRSPLAQMVLGLTDRKFFVPNWNVLNTKLPVFSLLLVSPTAVAWKGPETHETSLKATRSYEIQQVQRINCYTFACFIEYTLSLVKLSSVTLILMLNIASM